MLKKISRPLFVLFFLLMGFAAASPSHAAPPPIEPPFPPIPVNQFTIEYQRVNVTITDQIATTHIDQLFVNPNDWMVEGLYLFPLPLGASVSQLTMWVDGTPIEAKILAADEAQQIYDDIVRQLRDPALLKYVGTQAIQANVFPLPPNGERRVEIEYQQLLTAENGLFHYVYPQSNELYTNLPLQSQSIRVEVASSEAIRTIYSPSHAVAISREGDFAAVVGFEGNNIQADQDFALFYSVSPENIGLSLLTYKEPGENGFFVLLAAPSVEVDPTQVIAKDVILVLDTSGSMFGEKMDQAKEAASYVISQLNPQDRFSLITFSTGVVSYQSSLVSASEAGNVSSFINSIEAIGGTNISQSLLEAIAIADQERPTTIIFLTDGLATEGITDTGLLLDTMSQAARPNVRLFAFGVGDDVDTFLLDSLAQNHRGTTTYVRPGQAIDEAVSGFFAKISTPVLSDISLDYDGIVVEQLYPDTLPDLFAGSQLVLVGRYRDSGAAAITLRGTVNGQEQVFTYSSQNFRSTGGDDFIPRLWATRAIGHLLTEIRLNGENPELVQSVINLSVRYGIITPYTSFLIEEDDIFTQTGRDDVANEAMQAAATAPAPVSGGAAVDAAADQGEMAEAEAPSAPPAYYTDQDTGQVVDLSTVVQAVGSKTFVWRDGVWLDTAFDPEQFTPEAVGFASDTYFDLLAAAPELGQYFAIGQQVVVVYNGVAYQVVEGEGNSTVTIPTSNNDTSTTSTNSNTTTSTTGTDPVAVVTTANGSGNSSSSGGACGGAAALPLGLLVLMGGFSLKRKKE